MSEFRYVLRCYTGDSYEDYFTSDCRALEEALKREFDYCLETECLSIEEWMLEDIDEILEDEFEEEDEAYYEWEDEG